MSKQKKKALAGMWILIGIGIASSIGYFIVSGINLPLLSYFDFQYGNFGFTAGDISETSAFGLGVIAILSFAGVPIVKLLLQKKR